MQTRRRHHDSGTTGLGKDADGSVQLGTEIPFVAMAAATSNMLETQRAMSLMWLEIGNEIAGHASRSLDLAFRSMSPPNGGRNGQGETAAREMVASHLVLTRKVLDRFAETGRDIAEVWGSYPDRVSSAAGRSAGSN